MSIFHRLEISKEGCIHRKEDGTYEAHNLADPDSCTTVVGRGKTPKEAVDSLMGIFNEMRNFIDGELKALKEAHIPDELPTLTGSLQDQALQVLDARGISVDKKDLLTQKWEQIFDCADAGFAHGKRKDEKDEIAETTVISAPEHEAFVIFHDGRFAYSVLNPTHQFFQDMENKDLVGESLIYEVNYENF